MPLLSEGFHYHPTWTPMSNRSAGADYSITQSKIAIYPTIRLCGIETKRQKKKCTRVGAKIILKNFLKF
jgi:hypothetical protein